MHLSFISWKDVPVESVLVSCPFKKLSQEFCQELCIHPLKNESI